MRRPTVEHLECRRLFSTAFGINLNINDYWRTAALWVNTANELAPWGAFNNPGTANSGLTYTSDGYPLANASTFMYLKGYPDGTYKLSYQGSATVTLSGMGQIVAGTQTTVGNVTTADVLINHASGGQLNINVSNINTANPFRALKLIEPGYAVNTTQVFNNKTIQQLQPFGVLRAMDLLYGNINNDVNWSDRTQPTDFLQTGTGGVAYEDLVALANETHNDLWINIPVNVTDDYVHQLAKLLRDTLDPTLKVHVEYGNELWHTAYFAGQQNYTNAQNNGALTSSYGNGRAGQQEAFKLKAFHDIFVSEFDPQNNNPAAQARFGFVFDGNPDINDRFNTEAFAYINQQYGSPSFLEAYARGMYINLTSAQDVNGLTMDGLFNDLDANMPQLVTDVAAARAFATQNGLKLFIYEGGQHLEASNFTNQSLKIAAQSDPRMGVLYQRLLEAAQADGADLFLHYGYIDSSNQYGSWGLMESADLAGSVKWDQVLRNVVTPGDANLDGAVDFSDFQILQATYQSAAAPAYWEQGDFNEDRYVTAADFYVWKANASGLTPAQQSTVDAFQTSLSSTTPPLPVVTVVATDAQAAEPPPGGSADPGTFTFTRTGDTSQPLTVYYRLLGSTATFGSDYTASPDLSVLSITFAAGAATATVVVTPLADTVQDVNEKVTVMLYAAGGYTLDSSNTSASITIADNTPAGLPYLQSGTIIGTDGSYQNNGNTRFKALDGNTSTIFDGPSANGNWVGLDLSTAKIVTSVRYYPRANWASRMVGGKFQGSNTADFSSGVVDLYTITATPPYAWSTATISNTTPFRYVRYYSPAGSYGNVAELEFYAKDVDTVPPTQPGTPTLVSETDTSITFNWAASSDAFGVTRYDIYRNGSLTGSSTTTSYTDTGLAASTGYTYTVKAYDAAGNGSTASNTATITTNAPPDTTPPTQPGTPSLVTATDTSISLTWTASADAVGVTRYDILRNGAVVGSSATNNYTDTGLIASTGYTYTIKAYDAALNSSPASNSAILTTNAPPDTTPPTQPGTPSLVSETDTSISLTWTASTDAVGVTRYDIYRGGTFVGSSTTNSYTDSGLTASTAYTYTVQAFDAAGNPSTMSAPATFTTNPPPDTTPPTQPGTPTLVTETDTSISISWTASTDAVGVTRYDVLRNGAVVGSSVTVSYTDTGLTGSTAYTYTVKAYDAAGNVSTASTAATFTTNAPPDTTPPTQPGTPSLVSATANSISLNWTASTDAVGVTRYDVSRNGVVVGSSATASYSDTGLAASMGYTYTVQAYDAAGNASTASTGATLSTTAPPDTTPPTQPGTPTLVTATATSLAMTWTASTDAVGVARYDIYRGGAVVGSSATNSYTDTGLAGSTTYTYSIKAYDAAGNGSTASNSATLNTSDITPPSKPAGLALVTKTDVTAAISWTASTDNVGVTRYDILRNGTKVGSSTTTSYSDSGLTASTAYSYTVQAFDAAGNASTVSDPLSVTTNASSTPAQLTGTVIGTSGSYSNNGNTRDKAFDGDNSTYFDSPNANGSWVGLDFGSAKVITSIAYNPRPPKTSGGTTTTWGSRMVGGKFQVSSTADFSSGVVTLYTITTAPTTTTQVTISGAGAYQYFRYLSPDGSYGNVAEIVVTGAAAGVDTVPPSKPGTPTLTSKTDTTAVIGWTASTDNVGVTRYDVYRNGTKVGSSTTSSYSDSGLTASTAYSYTVQAVDAAGNVSTMSDALSVTTNAPPDLTPPSKPTGLALASKTATTTSITWTSSTDNVGVVRYDVYRNAVKVGSSATASYADSGLTAGTTYSYTVYAYDAAGNASAVSDPLSVTTNAATTSTLTGSVIGTTGAYNNGTTTRDKAFDGDTTTYFDGPTANGNWVGLDLGTAKTVTQISYTPRPPKVSGGTTTTWGSRMVGGIFQASNTADFSSGVVNLYTITTAPTGTVTVSLGNTTAYRYVRYLSSNGSYGDVAEIVFTGF